MIGTTVLHQIHILLPPEDPSESPEVSLRVKEQECLSLLKRCQNMEEFRQAHAQILKWGFFSNPFCASNLVATCALSHWGSMDYACSIFRQIDQPGSFEYNTMIKGYVSDFKMENALLLYYEMLEKEVQSDNFTYPALIKACAWLRAIDESMQIHGHIFKLGFEEDLYVQNSLINMYGKCGKIELSCDVFKQIEHKDIASWSSIIAAHSSLGLWSECVQFFEEMIQDRSYRPEESLLVSVLSACSHLGALDLGRCLHGVLLRNFSELNVTVQTSLIDMYINCGCIEKGFCLFQRMSKKNHFSYSVMISGLAMHGRSMEALEVFSEMLDEGLQPDDVVYVGVLSACSRGGLVKEGLQFFNRMKFEHGIQPTIQHYSCMVDLMGRAGMLNEALEIIRSMPIKPNDVIWRSLLSACKSHHNLNIGETAAKSLSQLNSQNPSDLLMLSNMYARAQRWHDVAAVRTEIGRNRLNQTPGFSLVECKREVYKFVSQDKSHPQSKDIYEMIHQMEWQLKFEGYSPDTSQILIDVDEEEKKERLKAHSQKLAMAFALIHTSQGSPIRIARNVRMCSDCHTYTKFISHIYSREIIVRDRNQFHHFKDGACSCRDYC
ncbi:pentatricopeptide repeat-containing protein At1g31920 [Ricinus communis]|uniref:pentatricopeptide repeat-containing protein At1g31920 n=1 Tax=Ricinus communis TaxID=3988 RepID=UPI000772A245|nr:pentatricopeptide repeat-containing protein At1g31920 [Ricinus communis]|eukprot:XP_015574459.1 pentatricopeptide repeat-containing protein At1g31920 [Ricinus communis]